MGDVTQKNYLEKLGELYDEETVSLVVGVKQKRFVFHKGLLCSTLPFFARAFRGTFSEGQTQEMYLDDKLDDPLAYALFSHWLYRRALPAIGCDINGKKRNTSPLQYSPEAEEPYHNLYYLAEKWCASQLKAKTLRCIQEYHLSIDGYMDPKFIIDGYTNTPTGSSMRRYLADYGAYVFSCGNREFFSFSKGSEAQFHVEDQDIWLDIIDVLQNNLTYKLENPASKPENAYSEKKT